MFEPKDELNLDAMDRGTTGAEAKLVDELERQSQSEIQKLRAHERRAQNVYLEISPGNSSDQDDFALKGRTNDISEGGCGAVFTRAVLPGDIFRVSFDSSELDLPMVFARAMRCRMLSEGSFEVGFRFFNNIELHQTPKSDELL